MAVLVEAFDPNDLSVRFIYVDNGRDFRPVATLYCRDRRPAKIRRKPGNLLLQRRILDHSAAKRLLSRYGFLRLATSV
jgi:hypothetical protein